MFGILMQAREAVPAGEDFGFFQKLMHFLDTPAPYSPFSEYLLVMFILWLIARRANRRRTFDAQAQDVLDQKYAEGEISHKAYEKFRQEMALRPKR
ncbi:MAG TPA: hypothetical protein VK929_14680 [Longimicrobiales bacterium]|nr:hypothetical protein [Longimicrobiales bacterium]